MSDFRLFHLLHKSHRALFRLVDRTLEEKFDISSTQHAVLLALAENDGLPIGELASLVGIKAAATSGLIDRMADKKLLERKRSKNDGRSYKVYLLPTGADVVVDSKPLIKEANAKLLNGFSEADQLLISKFFETIINRANSETHSVKGNAA